MAKQELSKDDRLVVRIDKQTKDAFMARVGAEGGNASEIVLTWVRDYLAKESQRTPDITQMYADLEYLKGKIAVLEDEVAKKLAA